MIHFGLRLKRFNTEDVKSLHTVKKQILFFFTVKQPDIPFQNSFIHKDLKSNILVSQFYLKKNVASHRGVQTFYVRSVLSDLNDSDDDDGDEDDNEGYQDCTVAGAERSLGLDSLL